MQLLATLTTNIWLCGAFVFRVIIIVITRRALKLLSHVAELFTMASTIDGLLIRIRIVVCKPTFCLRLQRERMRDNFLGLKEENKRYTSDRRTMLLSETFLEMRDKKI
jgi:hypothetical protein